jgi:hypothetical protein
VSESLHPTEGVRLLLERVAVDPDQASARYTAAVFTPTERFDYDAVLSLDGGAELTPRTVAAPAALQDKLLAHARHAAREARRRRDETSSAWPHRLLRWRGPK